MQKLFAHGKEIETGGGGGGPVKLTKEQQAAIGLKTTKTEPRTIDSVLVLNGKVQLNPDLHAHVTSRIEGRIEKLYASDINERSITLGEAVEPNKELFHIIDLSEVIVVAEVYEEDVGKVKLGQDARVRVLSYPNESFDGKITFVGSELDPEKRTLPVWITVKNPDGKLKPEMFAKPAIVLAKNENVLAVPKEALMEEGGEKFVFVRTGDTFDRADVQTGAEDDRFVEIKDGLVPDDEIVVQGQREVYTAWLTGGKKPDAG
jgi:RND family efflux transporter MFP subunit